MVITAKDKLSIDQPFKIEAGPGAGKTEFLVNHIKNIVRHSKILGKTRRIACITYTNVGAETVLKRLGSNIADRVEVSTIHSFLYKNVVKPYCRFIPEEYHLCCEKIDGHDEVEFRGKKVLEWLEDKAFDSLRAPNTRKQLTGLVDQKKVLQKWLSCNQCTLSGTSIIFCFEDKKAFSVDSGIGIKKSNLMILKNNFLKLKMLYWQEGILAHDDVLFFAYILITKYPFIIQVLRARYPYLFIDEYQDTNPIQSSIIDKIKSEEVVIGIIGDKAQSIYSFQGAKVSLFDDFKIEESNTFTIVENHRSSDQIVKFLNDLRSDIQQKACRKDSDGKVMILLGSEKDAYNFANELCQQASVVSLSRDNLTSNKMKYEGPVTNIKEKIEEEYFEIDKGERRYYVWNFIQAIELARENNYKKAIKKIEWLFRNRDNPRKITLLYLQKMIERYEEYHCETLMRFYEILCSTIDVKLPTFKKGKPQEFYNNTMYIELAVSIKNPDDVSEHITIHKSKGNEYENVLVTEDKNIIDFLLNPNISENEEHRVLYVAMSRARNNLFLQYEDIPLTKLKKIKNKYPYVEVKTV